MTPSVSVIMPVYNGENVITDAVQSVINQTYSDFELIIVDDCSIDNTAVKVLELAQQDSRIIVIQNITNLGAAESRNKGCNCAQGKYLAFLDGDDLWMADKIDKQVAYLERNECDFSYTAFGFMDSTGKYLGKDYLVPKSIKYEELLCKNVILCSSVMMKTTAFQDHKFDNRFFHEDLRLWLELLREGKQAGGLEEVLVLYRSGGRSSNRLRSAQNRWLIYRKAERLSFLKSFRCFVCYAYNAIKKYYFAIS